MELKDFFPDFKEDKTGTVRNKGNKRNIDFSYMDYEGARIYAPTDGRTYQIYEVQKDLVEKHMNRSIIQCRGYSSLCSGLYGILWT